MKLAKKDGNWVIPVQVVVDGNKSEQEARKSVGDLLAQGVGYCADPGSIESYKIGTQAAK